jgi:hypothetical protein
MTATTIRVQMAQRKDTAANWTAANPILLSGEIGYETDTKKFKIGDGSTNWNTLAYLPIPDGSGNLTITGNLEIGTTGSLTFEGSTANGFETTLAVTDPTADRTITLPNVSGTIITTGDTGSVTSTMLLDGTIVNADISDIAEIAVSKLANGTANQVIVTDGTNVSWSDNLTLAGRLLVGTSTARVNYYNSAGIGSNFQVVGSTHAESSIILHNQAANTQGAYFHIGKSRGTAYEVVNNDDPLGVISFQGADGSTMREGANITAFVDGVPGASDLPSRLVFSVTADGASSPTERMRIDSSGRVFVGTTSSPGNGNEKVGISSSADGIWLDITSSGGTGIVIDRTAEDGDLINFLQAGAQEGVIFVSGTTVTYGGGHLARWSQLPNGEDPSGLLKGTVMSNLDEMCEWGEEDNEQLNRTKVSDIEGDPNVAGVFVSTSPSEDGPLDFFVGMTGDMIIRIAESVTVQRGDLLMSAGDGTAKPQSDDIIRSKTIAKVTSTHVTCTYDDGSYCVPCVLMAC